MLSVYFVPDVFLQSVCPCALIIEDIPHKPNAESFKTDDVLRKRLVALFKGKLFCITCDDWSPDAVSVKECVLCGTLTFM